MENFLYKILILTGSMLTLVWFAVYKKDRSISQKQEKPTVSQQVGPHKPVLDYEKLQQGIVTSMLAGAIGDAMGRVTEFIPSTEKIFQTYPNGIRSFDDFLPKDWVAVPKKLKEKGIVPYTDDTRMAKLVFSVLQLVPIATSPGLTFGSLFDRDTSGDAHGFDHTMSLLARAFVEDMQDETYGWSAPFRVPGNATLASVKKLATVMPDADVSFSGERVGDIRPKSYTIRPRFYTKKLGKDWWKVGHPNAGGSGTVMRAHPFGLVFFYDLDKAVTWAAEHAKLTHGHPMALAAPAAMAVGIVYALQEKDPAFIVDQMIRVAEKYDVTTANKMREARALAEQVKPELFRLGDVYAALNDLDFRKLNDKVFTTFKGWAADDAIAAVVYIFKLVPDDVMQAIYLGVHTPGDSDTIASIAGALVGAYTKQELPAKLVQRIEDAEEFHNLGKSLIQGFIIRP